MYEELKKRYCVRCEMKTGHTTFTEGRIHVCAICGTEIKFKPGEKGPAPKKPKPAPYAPKVVVTETKADKSETKAVQNKTEGKLMRKLTAENIEEIKRRRSEGEKPVDLAKEFKVSAWTIYTSAKVQNVKAEKKDKPARQDSPVGGFKQQLALMVSEAVDRRLAGLGLDSLDAKIEDALARMLK